MEFSKKEMRLIFEALRVYALKYECGGLNLLAPKELKTLYERFKKLVKETK